MTPDKTSNRCIRALRWLSAAGLTAILAACGGGGGGGGGGAATGDGALRVALTDAPSCGYDHVWVTVERVRVHQSAGAGDAEAGWTDLVVSPARRVDLLDLTNGVLEELGTVALAPGRYSQVRLVLASNGTGTSTFANSVQPTGGTITALATPSAQQSGLKLQANIEVAAGQTADLVLDFDACKSVVKAGNSGNYNLKPVVSVVPRILSGIQGYITTTFALSSTTVSAQQNGTTVRSTTPDSTGKFSIPYLGTGTYAIVVASEGRATAVVTGVTAGTSTTVINGTATAITSPVSTMVDVTGTATTVSGSSTVPAVLTDGNVRALQSLTGGPVIERGSQPLDSTLGTYRHRLPTSAPVKAAYTAGNPLSFTADTAAAGKYTLQLQSTGRANQDRPLDISGGAAATVNFSYGP